MELVGHLGIFSTQHEVSLWLYVNGSSLDLKQKFQQLGFL